MEIKLENLDETRLKVQQIIENIQNVIIGKNSAVELAVVTLICQGHALIEDVPGVGKTMLARSLSKSIGCEFSRIQFTPDLLPSDITGVSIYNQQTGEFQYKPGPVVSQIVLADEINRATPKTQSALLEAMDEKQVTVEGKTYKLPRPFIVMATQNPIEFEGTFPLPEAQLDRFFLKISLGYPSKQEEIQIVENQKQLHPIENLQEVASDAEINEIQESIKEIYIDERLKEYIVEAVEMTRTHDDVALGSSPRGSIAMFNGTKALAFIRGRDFVLPDDIKELANPILGHRIVVSSPARMRGVQSNDIIDSILSQISVPGNINLGR
jgi:MoxR-like ATPase